MQVFESEILCAYKNLVTIYDKSNYMIPIDKKSKTQVMSVC